MKNNILFLWTGVVEEKGEFHTCILSLKSVSNCNITVATPFLTKPSEELLISLGVNIKHFDKKLWDNRRMTCKIEQTYEFLKSLPENSNLFVYDGDMLFLKDPFDVFSEEFNFAFTTRNSTTKEWVSTNGGCIGFKNNKKSRKFLDFFISNLNNPTWEPYLNFRKRHPHNRDINNKDWWVDQDFGHCVNVHKDEINRGILGFDVKVKDISSNYNFICKGDEIEYEIKNKTKHVLHYKTSSYNRWKDGVSVDK